jgi:hypothetical protein
MRLTVEDLYRMHPQWRRHVPLSRPTGATPEPIEDAWVELVSRLLGDGIVPHRLLNVWALTITHRYWAASIVARDFATDNPSDSRWERLAEDYWKRSQDEYERLGLQRDSDEDGVADSPDTLDPATPPLYLTSVPGWGR